MVLTSAGKDDAFVAKLTPDGRFVWTTQLGGEGADRGWAIAADQAGHISVVGTFSGVAHIQNTELVASGGLDMFVMSLEADSGAVVWGRGFGGLGEDFARGVAVDRGGNVYVTGRFCGTAAFGQFHLASKGNGDIFVVKLVSGGAVQWASRAGGLDTDYYRDERGWGIAVDDRAADPAGWNVYICGILQGADADFGSTVLSPVSNGSDDAFVAKLQASDGQFSWARPLAGNMGEYWYAVCVDDAGGVYATGVINGSGGVADFDPGPGARLFTARGSFDSFIVRLDEQGNYVSAWQITDTDDAQCWFIADDGAGRIYAGGNCGHALFPTGDRLVLPERSQYDRPGMDSDRSPRGAFIYRFDPSLTHVEGKVFLDRNGDGSRAVEPDVPEPNAGGWTVYIDENGDGLHDSAEPSTVTRSDGSYHFNLSPGAYTFRLEPQQGWQETSPVGGAHTLIVPASDPSVPLAAGEFGVWHPTEVHKYPSTNTPATLTGRVSYWTIQVPDAATVADIEVELDLHRRAGERRPAIECIRIDLIGPDGTSVEVSAHVDETGWPRVANGEDLIGTIFDDEAAENFAQKTSPYTGRVVPFDFDYYGDGLGLFRGKPAQGVWTLRITDDESGQGVLNSWELHITTLAGAALPSAAVSDMSLSEGDAGTTDADFTVTLSAASQDTVSVAYATADDTARAGLDYTATSGALVFAPGETTKTVRVPVLGEESPEDDERFFLNLSSPTGATIGDGTGECLILDDDETGWLFRIGGEGTDTATKVAVAGDGTVYVAGAFQGCVDFDPGPLVHELTAAGVYDGFLAKYNPDRSLAWREQVAMGRGTVCQRDGWGGVEDIALDDDGNVYVAGWFSGKAMFGGTVLETTGQFDELDAFVARYTPGGELAWVKHIAVGASGDARAYGLAVGRHGDVYATGEFYDTAAFDSTVLTSAGTSESFVACLSAADGEIAWANSLGGLGRDLGYAVAVTSGGDPVVAGHFSDTAIIGGQAVTSRGESDSYVARLDRLTGQSVWVRQLGGEGIDESWALAADEQGNICTTGTFTSTAQFGSQSLTSAGGQDVYLTKLDASGALLWTRQLGGAGDDTSVALTLDALGRPYVRGHFQGSVDFDPGPGVAMRSTRGTSDGFVWELDAQGAFRRAWQMGGAGCSSGGGGIALDDDGSVYVAGGFSGHGTITTPVGDLAAISDDADVFLLKMTVGVPVPDPPLATSDSYVANANRQLTVASPGLLANDTIASGAALEAVLVAGPAHGTLTLAPDGSFLYQPEAGYTGSDSFNYRATDGQTSSNAATVTITVTPNRAPVAGNNYYTARMNAVFTVAAPGPLAEDWDANGDPLTASLVAGPAHGTLVFNADGSFTYTPNPGYQGRDVFTYQASDGEATSNTATVEINVVPNAKPVPLDDVYAVNAGRNVDIHAPGVLLNDIDSDGDTLTAILADGPQHGTLTFNADGSFSYIPEDGYIGDDRFTYRTNDGYDHSALATVTIQVKPPAADGSWAFAIGGPLEDVVNSMRMDAQGNIYVAGAFRGTVDFDPGPGRTELTASGEFRDFDAFLAKYSPAGELVWVQSIKNAMAVRLAIDAADDVYLIANFGGVTQVGAVELRSKAKTDSFAAKFSSDGTVLWAQDLGMGDSGAYGLDIAAGRNNDVYVAGMFTISAFGRSHALVNTTWTDAALAKLDSRDGAVQWGEQVEGIFQDFALVVAVDAAGYPYLHGMLWDVAKFDDIEIECNGEDNCDTFLAKFDVEDGHALWAEALGGTSLEFVEAIAADDHGYLYLAGAFWEETDFGGHRLVSAGESDGYLVKVDGDGNVLWAKSVGGSGEYDSICDIAVDDDGLLHLAGVFDGTADFDPGPGVAMLSSPDFRAGFSLALDREGRYQRAWKLDGPLEPLSGGHYVGFGLEVDAVCGAIGMAAVKYGEGPVEFPAGTWVNLPGDEWDVYVVRFELPAGVNAAPTAENDMYDATAGVPLSVTSPGVLINDSDANTDSLTAILIDGPDHGSFLLNPDGSFRYTPTLDFSGTDSFTYRVSDGEEESATATVTINVRPLLTVAEVSVLEGAIATLTVTLAQASSTALAFDYITVDGTATGGSDYQFTSGQFVVPPGSTVWNVTVPATRDFLKEGDEAFYVSFSIPGGIEMLRAPVAIRDYPDPAGPTLVIEIEAFIDGHEQLMIWEDLLAWYHFNGAITGLNEPALVTTYVDGRMLVDHYAWHPDWIYPYSEEEQGSLWHDILVPGLPNSITKVTLEPLQSRGSTALAELPSPANDHTLIVDINDDAEGAAWYKFALIIEYVVPGPQVFVYPTAGLVTKENGTEARFSVVLDTAPTDDVTFVIASSDNTEGIVAPATLTFTPENWSVPQTVTVTGLDDYERDGSVRYYAIIAPAVSSDPQYSGLDPQDVSVINRDEFSGWAIDFGAAGTTLLSDIATDNGGDVYITGTLDGVADFDPSENVHELQSTPDEEGDGFIVRYSGAGELQWARQLAVGVGWGEATAVAVDGQGNVYCAGGFSVQAAFGTEILRSPGADGAYVAKYAADGTLLWVRQLGMGDAADSAAWDVAVDTGDGVYVVGQFYGRASFGSYLLTSQESLDVFLVKLDGSDGEVLWAQQAGGPDRDDGCWSVGVVGTSVYIAGEFEGTAGFGPYTVTSAGDTDCFIARIDAQDGQYAWVRQMGGSGMDDSWALAADDAGHVYVTGGFEGNCRFGDQILKSEGYLDAYLTKLDSDGKFFWTRGLGGPDVDCGIDVALDPSGLPYVTGFFMGAAIVDREDGIDWAIVSRGSLDAFLWSLDGDGDFRFASVIGGMDCDTWPAGLAIDRWGNIFIAGDFLGEGDISCPIGTVLLGDDASFILKIAADRAPDLIVTPASGLTTSEAGSTASFSVVLGRRPVANVTVDLFTSDATEGAVSPTRLVFTPDDWDVPRTVIVTGQDDDIDDGDAHYSVRAEVVASDDPYYQGMPPAYVGLTNLDDDTAGVTLSPISGVVTTEAGGTAIFTAMLNSQPLADVTLDLSSANPAEGVLLATRLVFTPADWNVPQTVTVSGVDDRIDDGDAGYTIITAALISTDPNYSGLDPADVVLTNLDDDTASVTIIPTSVS